MIGWLLTYHQAAEGYLGATTIIEAGCYYLLIQWLNRTYGYPQGLDNHLPGRFDQTIHSTKPAFPED